MGNKIDETIVSICGWINKKIESNHCEHCEAAEMVKALASLIEARAKIII